MQTVQFVNVNIDSLKMGTADRLQTAAKGAFGENDLENLLKIFTYFLCIFFIPTFLIIIT